jgi:hypothetical protein
MMGNVDWFWLERKIMPGVKHRQQRLTYRGWTPNNLTVSFLPTRFGEIRTPLRKSQQDAVLSSPFRLPLLFLGQLEQKPGLFDIPPSFQAGGHAACHPGMGLPIFPRYHGVGL